MLSKKKFAAILLTCIMTLVLLTGCGGHSHTDSGEVAIDLDVHAKICYECGERFDRESHTIVDFICTGCGCEIFTYDDGTVQQFAIYDDNGNQTRMVTYTPEGEEEYAYECQYNENNELVRDWDYYSGVLAFERAYIMDADGFPMVAQETSYNEDGTYSVIEYDEYGNQTLEAYYDAGGKVESEYSYVNTYDADGNQTLQCTYENGVLIQEMEFIFGSDEDGSWSMSGKTTNYHGDGTYTVSDSDQSATWATEITYDADGNVINELRYEYEYNDNGDSIGSRAYENGRLTQEVHAIVGEDGETIGLLRTYYEEDGSKTVCEYNTDFDVVKETVYDAKGNVVSESFGEE